jgi:hypothetical protein
MLKGKVVKMSKIIKEQDKFKQVKCLVCGCVYEYDKGDNIEIINLQRTSSGNIAPCFTLLLKCPICEQYNVLEKDNAEKEKP